jgi:hypothetical protein
MKNTSLRKSLAPTPRLTFWVPVTVAVALSLFWLGLLALIGFDPTENFDAPVTPRYGRAGPNRIE